jgi:hypothetical protein
MTTILLNPVNNLPKLLHNPVPHFIQGASMSIRPGAWVPGAQAL